MLAAAALERAASARVIDEHAPHHLRGDGEELGAALPARVVLAVEPEPRLVHERGGLEGVALALAAQRARRLPAQLRVDERHERFGSARVAGAPRAQQLGDVVRRELVAVVAIGRKGYGAFGEGGDMHAALRSEGQKPRSDGWTLPTVSGFGGVLRATG